MYPTRRDGGNVLAHFPGFNYGRFIVFFFFFPFFLSLSLSLFPDIRSKLHNNEIAFNQSSVLLFVRSVVSEFLQPITMSSRNSETPLQKKRCRDGNQGSLCCAPSFKSLLLSRGVNEESLVRKMIGILICLVSLASPNFWGGCASTSYRDL
ncbi:hypothetical protein CEXT_276431 [Caerostris extrusa]|uniref:Transmembrane protein n=1 Tax=Caerostris extrusa TaxID=172846 RepID=A0AAV4PBQ4_CAEEX|nr:hypothetical protein CEXT_276431 [Caerostris extrusa]